MRKQGVIALLGLTARLSHATASQLPRGVGPEFAQFYKNTQTFTCISAPSIHLSPSQINDDYCDCPDGSDEPGSAACSYLSPLSPSTPPHPNATSTGAIVSTNALPGFYCKNKGHNPSYIRFTHVNDGICDYNVCCDGSDEYGHVGGVSCPDKCKEIGKEWRKQDESRQKSHNAALQKRRDLVGAAAKQRAEIAQQISTLVSEIASAEAEVSKLEKEQKDIEIKEANRVVKNEGRVGKVGILAGLAKGRVQEMRAAMARVKAQRDAYVDRVEELEELLTTFQTEYNPNFNDEGVKRAVRAWEEYAATEKTSTLEKNTPEERDLTSIMSGPDSDGIDWEEFESGEDAGEDDVAALYNLTSYLPPTFRAWLSTQLSTLRQLLIINGILASPSTSTSRPESKAVRDATSRLQNAESTLNSARTRKTDAEKDLDAEYGDDDVFRTLKDKCVSLDSGEYTYELCWLDRVSQKSKKGGGQQAMGRFDKFDMEVVDEDIPADWRGLGAGERVVMRYVGGSHCWNGPARSTSVVLGCAEVEEIWRVAEEEKCVYRMEVGTPAVCVDEKDKKSSRIQKEGKADGVKDEL